MDNFNNPSAPLPQYPAQPSYPAQQPYPAQAPAAAPLPQAAPTGFAPSPQAQNPAQYGVKVVDSLSANEFSVQINGQTVTGVFAVSGLNTLSLRVDENGKPIGIAYPPLTITKMVQQDPTLPFNQWVREAVQARGTVLPTREITVIALDEGVETRRWVYRNAWISSVTFSDFDTALDYLVEEKVVIQHGGVEEIYPSR